MPFGSTPNVHVGAQFPDRDALRVAGVHYQPQAEIAGRAADGAESIVLNEGYEDDQDFGDEIVYTGPGRARPEYGRQIADQPMTLGNLALVTSQLQGIPVRVVRGYRLRSPYRPSSGYRYDGLYTVESPGRKRVSQAS